MMELAETLETARKLLRLDSVDDYLGPAATRFFGSGYRRVTYSWREPGGTGPVQAVASVDYPQDWSRKRSATALRPHLSTIDALVLGVRAAELALLRGGLLPADGAAWLRRVDIRAGRQPIEDGLDEFVVGAALSGTTAVGPDRAVSTVRGSVATMTVTCEIEHGVGSRPAAADPGAGHDRAWWGAGFRVRDVQVRDVRIAGDTAGAALTVGVEEDGAPLTGRIDAAPLGAASMLDSFVASLQLGQILLYEADGLTRAESETLWMRTTTITATEPQLRSAGTFPVTTSLIDSTRIVARGEPWRTATIHGEGGGVRTRCAVAHRLPTLFSENGEKS